MNVLKLTGDIQVDRQSPMVPSWQDSCSELNDLS